MQYKTTYHISNGNDAAARVLIKHARRGGARLFKPPAGTEDNTGTSSALVPTVTGPNTKSDATIDERMVTERQIDWFSPLADEAVRTYLADPRADAAAVAALRNAWVIRPTLIKLFDESNALRDEQAELSRDTEETRNNLKSLEKNTAAATLRAQLTARLAKSALRLNEITKRMVEIELAQNEQRVRFTEAVRSIKMTHPLPPPT